MIRRAIQRNTRGSGQGRTSRQDQSTAFGRRSTRSLPRLKPLIFLALRARSDQPDESRECPGARLAVNVLWKRE
jgi:hypothetical protein